MRASIEGQLVKKKASGSVLDNLVYGCYVIMRKLKSYRVQDFLSEDFKMPQYFLLCELIKEEIKEQEKEHKKAQQKMKKGRRR